MRKNDYLAKAKRLFHICTIIKKEPDELYLNEIAFQLQQTVEFALKHLLNVNDISYPKTHDIDTLIMKLEENKLDGVIPQYIKDNADTFTNWETKTRYVMDFSVRASSVDRAFQEIPKFLECVEKECNISCNQEKQLSLKMTDSIFEKLQTKEKEKKKPTTQNLSDSYER